MKVAVLYPTTPDAATKAYSIYPEDWTKEERLLSIRLAWPEMNGVTTCAPPYPKTAGETADFVSRMLSAAVASNSNLIVVSRSEVVYRRLQLHLAQGVRLILSVIACRSLTDQQLDLTLFDHSTVERDATVASHILRTHGVDSALDRNPRVDPQKALSIASRDVRHKAVMKVDEQIKNGEGV